MHRQQRIHSASEFLREKLSDFQPEIGMILGSGLGILADEISAPLYIPYGEIPGFPVSTVEGHAGRFVAGELEGKKVLAMQGRFHYYEGLDIDDLALPVRVMHSLNIKTLLVTNAAGGVNPNFAPGDLMLIKDHINFMFNNPLMGANLSDLGPRFPDTSRAYTDALRENAKLIAAAQNIKIQEGTYYAQTGPSYETPAEVQMAKKLGADAVGMSTVPEVIAAAHCGMQVLGISSISNLAAGIADHPLSHAEVIETMDRVKDKFITLIKAILQSM